MQIGGKMILTKLRPIFTVDLSAKKDDPLDSAFRHCRIEERDGLRLARTFTGKVPRSQSTANTQSRTSLAGVRSIPRVCPNGGAAVLDLDHAWKPV